MMQSFVVEKYYLHFVLISQTFTVYKKIYQGHFSGECFPTVKQNGHDFSEPSS